MEPIIATMTPTHTRYARSGSANIAYQVVGRGDMDLVMVPAFMSNIELGWEQPSIASFLHRLAAFSRLILFDRRGNGMSDGTAVTAPLEAQIDDVRAVLDAAGSRRPALIAVHEGAALALLFAATHPELVRALVLVTPQARLVSGPGYEWALSARERAELIDSTVSHWGVDSPANPWMALAGGADAEQRHLMARYQRLGMGPGDARTTMEALGDTDVRGVLTSIQSPTLVLRRREDSFIDERHSRYVAERIPAARYVQLPGSGQLWEHGAEDAAHEIQAFLTGKRPPVLRRRTLATVLFTDIVGSTRHVSDLGDSRWRDLLERHDAVAATEIQRYRGRLVKALGDGVLALFDGPSRAIECALAIRERMAGLGLRVRAGLHTGECELLAGDDVTGIAVNIAARVSALAQGGEVLVTSTVRDLSAGADVTFVDRGERRLEGITEPRRVFAAGTSESATADGPSYASART